MPSVCSPRGSGSLRLWLFPPVHRSTSSDEVNNTMYQKREFIPPPKYPDPIPRQEAAPSWPPRPTRNATSERNGIATLGRVRRCNKKASGDASFPPFVFCLHSVSPSRTRLLAQINALMSMMLSHNVFSR